MPSVTEVYQECLSRKPIVLSFEVSKDGPGCLGPIERVEVNPRSSLLQKFAALFGGMVNATALDLDTVVVQSFDALEQTSRNARPAHLGDAFDLWGTEDGHDARNDGDRDPNPATTLDEPKVIGIVKKKLRH